LTLITAHAIISPFKEGMRNFSGSDK